LSYSLSLLTRAQKREEEEQGSKAKRSKGRKHGRTIGRRRESRKEK